MTAKPTGDTPTGEPMGKCQHCGAMGGHRICGPIHFAPAGEPKPPGKWDYRVTVDASYLNGLFESHARDEARITELEDRVIDAIDECNTLGVDNDLIQRIKRRVRAALAGTPRGKLDELK